MEDEQRQGGTIEIPFPDKEAGQEGSHRHDIEGRQTDLSSLQRRPRVHEAGEVVPERAGTPLRSSLSLRHHLRQITRQVQGLGTRGPGGRWWVFTCHWGRSTASVG